MAVNDGNNLGWPHVNYAMEIRGTRTGFEENRHTIVYPRWKYTYIAELVLNSNVTTGRYNETNLVQFLNNGRIYAVIKSIEKPKSSFAYEKLRSYNKNVIIPTKAEYQPSNMVLYDDAASMASALWKEIRAFYHYEGKIGRNAVFSGSSAGELSGEYRLANSIIGSDARRDMENKPSLGLTLRHWSARHFFDAIYIYDLGSDPDSVNVYCYVYPFVNSVAFDNMDHEDSQSLSNVTMTFDYEGYYHTIGMNNSDFVQIIEKYLKFPAPVSPSVKGHVVTNPNFEDNSSGAEGLVPLSSLNGASNIVSDRLIGPQ